MPTTLNCLFVLLAVLFLSSCDSSYQVDVYVQNNSSDSIVVHVKRSAEEAVDIPMKAGEKKIIISTENIELTEEVALNSTPFKNLVAESISCTNSQNKTSSLNWTSPDIKFEEMDIGQAEYLLNITDNHFE